MLDRDVLLLPNSSRGSTYCDCTVNFNRIFYSPVTSSNLASASPTLEFTCSNLVDMCIVYSRHVAYKAFGLTLQSVRLYSYCKSAKSG